MNSLTMRKIMLSVLLLAVLVVAGTNAQAQTIDVSIAGFAFNADSITIPTGATVRWTNDDGAPHTSTSDSPLWDSGTLTTGQQFSHTFAAPGVYTYHCTIHPAMTAVVVVVDPIEISIAGFAFNPDSIMIPSGTMVRWTNDDGAPHTSTSDDPLWDSGTLNTGDKYFYTFNDAGVYPYHCTIHPAMTAVVVVVDPVEISIAGFAFNPDSINVVPGTMVRWTNEDGVEHSSTSDSPLWDSGLLSTGEQFSYTFNDVGVYPYHCTPHPGMTAVVVVEEPGCCLQRGDALHDNQLVLVNDLVFLVNYVFKGGPAPVCTEEGDALADNGLILVNDLVFLVNYVFKGGPAPGPC